MFYDNKYGPREPDRESTNESDGQHFVGYDDKETGTTAWYDDDGNLLEAVLNGKEKLI